MTAILWQLENSIYCEKAHFALAYKGVPYERRDLLPGLHGIQLALRGKGRTVPVFELDGRRAGDSTDVIALLEERWPEPPLYPSDPEARRQALELEDFFDEYVGHDVRRLLLDAALTDRDAFLRGQIPGTPAALRPVVRGAFPLTKAVTRRMYGIDAESLELAHRRVDDAFARVEERARDGDYLVGDSFTVADLTGAALLAPLVLPPETPETSFTVDDAPAGVRELRDGYAGRPGFAWVQEMYRRHRAAGAVAAA